MEPYTAQGVRTEVEKNRERLFAPLLVSRPPNWTPDQATKDFLVVCAWLGEELVRLKTSDEDRRTQLHFFNRHSREQNVFKVAVEALNAVLEGKVENYRTKSGTREHRGW